MAHMLSYPQCVFLDVPLYIETDTNPQCISLNVPLYIETDTNVPLSLLTSVRMRSIALAFLYQVTACGSTATWGEKSCLGLPRRPKLYSICGYPFFFRGVTSPLLSGRHRRGCCRASRCWPTPRRWPPPTRGESPPDKTGCIPC